MPDIISINGFSYYVENAVRRGMVMDLMPYIEADEKFKEEIPPAVFEAWESSGAENIGYAAYPTEDGSSLAYVSPSAGYVSYNNRIPERERHVSVS